MELFGKFAIFGRFRTVSEELIGGLDFQDLKVRRWQISLGSGNDFLSIAGLAPASLVTISRQLDLMAGTR
jgi:hypothetical protein